MVHPDLQLSVSVIGTVASQQSAKLIHLRGTVVV